MIVLLNYIIFYTVTSLHKPHKTKAVI